MAAAAHIDTGLIMLKKISHHVGVDVSSWTSEYLMT